MDFLNAIFLGIIQGITEFLPISSSGHLFLAEEFLGLIPDLHFEVSLHVASLLAVLVVFWKDIWDILRGLGKTCGICAGDKNQGIFGWKLLIASLATVPVALLLESQFEFFRTTEAVAVTLIITGFLILGSEVFRPKQERNFDWWIVIVLGLLQGIAVLPGISRAGITISILILLGIDRKQSAKISFLLAVPTILAALIFTGTTEGFVIDQAQYIGCIASLFAAIFAMRWMMRLVRRHWIWFAPYCIIAGAVLLIFFV
jgi:undecaprenyl-diphosphatase